MYWGRIVAAIYSLSTVLMELVYTGVFITSQSFPFKSIPQLEFAGGLFLSLAVFGLPGALLALHRVPTAPQNDDRLVEGRLLVLLRVMMGSHVVYFALHIAEIFVLGTPETGAYNIVVISLTALVMVMALVMTFFAFTRHNRPSEGSPKTNKVAAVSLVVHLLGFLGVTIAAILNLAGGIGVETSKDAGWRAGNQIPRNMVLTIFPLFLVFKNNVRELLIQDLVLSVIGLPFMFLGCVLFFVYNVLLAGEAYSGTVYSTVAILSCMGYVFFMIGIVLDFINVIRLRKRHAGVEYAALNEESPLFDKDEIASAPVVEATAPPPPSYPVVTAPPAYQEPPRASDLDFQKEPVEEVVQLPAAYQTQVYNNNHIGEFDYDKQNP